MILDSLKVKMPSKQKKKNSNQITNPRLEAVRMLNHFQKDFIPLNLLFDRHQFDLEISKRDRNFVSELVYGTVRWQIQLDWILKQFVHGNLNKLPESIQNILRSGLYQLRFLKNIPTYAVLNEAVQLTRSFHLIKYSRLVNGVLRNYLRNEEHLLFPKSEENLVQSLVINHSFPEWMVELVLDQYGLEKTESILESSNRRPQLTLRVNKTKISVEDFVELLTDKNIGLKRSEIIPEFINLNENLVVQDIPGYAEGFFSIQNESAGIVSHLAKLDGTHDKIADVCAAPGGKLSHLAEILFDQISILGADISLSRLKLIQKNLRRLGLYSIRFIQADCTQLPFSNLDVILIDAPCSGLGVIRKNPDIKIRRKPKDLNHAVKQQMFLLEEAAKRLNNNGVLIYSTCSINNNENENLISNFLKSHSEFFIENASNFVKKSLVSTEGWVKTTPDTNRCDGSFSVRLRKEN